MKEEVKKDSGSFDLTVLRGVAEKAYEIMPCDWAVGELLPDTVNRLDTGGTVARFSLLLPDVGAHIATFNPSTCLALLDRVEALEKERLQVLENIEQLEECVRDNATISAALILRKMRERNQVREGEDK